MSDVSTPRPPASPEEGAAPPRVDGGTAKGAVEVQELSRGQQVLARRMAEAKAIVPEFTLEVDVDVEDVVALRAALAAAAGPDDVVPSYDDVVVKACGIALREHPRANGAYRDAKFELHERVNVGVTVGTADGLVVPTVFDADRKGLGEIARETRTFAERARAGIVTPPELSGGTFTVASLGAYGIDRYQAIIAPPQAAVLAVGAVAARAVVRDGAVVARHTVSLTLACDHRILYGADAAAFLARVRDLLESPSGLAL